MDHSTYDNGQFVKSIGRLQHGQDAGYQLNRLPCSSGAFTHCSCLVKGDVTFKAKATSLLRRRLLAIALPIYSIALPIHSIDPYTKRLRPSTSIMHSGTPYPTSCLPLCAKRVIEYQRQLAVPIAFHRESITNCMQSRFFGD